MICLRFVRARRPLAALSAVSVWAAAAAALISACVPVSVRAVADSMLPGTLDTSFAPILNEVTLYAVAVDSKGRVAYGGDSHTFARFTDNGRPDPTFSFSEFGASNRIVFGLAIDRLDRVYTVGGFDPSNSNEKSVNITRFFSDGSRVNRGFDAGAGANHAIVTVLVQPINANPDDDKVVVGGQFTKFDGADRLRLTRINANGSLDDSFDGGLNVDGDVYALALQNDPASGAPNGQILCGGGFVNVDGKRHSKFARLNFDGTVDESFAPSVDQPVFAIAPQLDGKIIIGGQFGVVNGHRANGLARLNADGSFDATFSAAISEDENQGMPPTAVYALQLQADGRLVVGGNFLNINGVRRRFIGRLNADGSVDNDFNANGIIANSVEALAIQQDHKIVVGEIVSKKVDDRYPNVIKRLYGNPLPPPLATMSIIGMHRVVENGEKGFFRVYRSSNAGLSTPMTAHYQTKTSGTRPKSGVDYEPLSGSVTIPAGATSAKIRVAPLGSTLAVDGERLKLKLVPSANYNVEGSGTSTIPFNNKPAE